MFNKTKPYSEVCGGTIPYKYEQGGRYYDHQYNEVKEDGAPVPGGEYIPPEMEAKPAKAAAPEPANPYENSLAVGGEADDSSPVPETEIPLADAADMAIDDIDSLKLPEIKEQLDRLGVSYDKTARKADLKAILADELATQAIEAEQEARDTEDSE